MLSGTTHQSHTQTARLPVSRTRIGVFLCALIACIFGLLGVPSIASVHADEPATGTNSDDNGFDTTRPHAPVNPTRAELREKLEIPNKDRAMFRGIRNKVTGKIVGGIQDFEPVANEAENKNEYDSWGYVITHASERSTDDLEAYARRDLIRDDLARVDSPLDTYRLEVIRFDGHLTKVRRLSLTRSLTETGVAELYEALLVPQGEPFPGDPEQPTANAISFVFTKLPPTLATKLPSPLGTDWHKVDAWATVAGYFFKVVQDDAASPALPILIGRSVTVREKAPAITTELDKDLQIYQTIKNDDFVAKEEGWREGAAWTRVLIHANQFEPEELERHATSLAFADLFNDGRQKRGDNKDDFQGKRQYKLDLVKFEGRLVRLNAIKPNEKLRAAGVQSVYEGWLVPQGEPSGNPVCIVFTNLPKGIEPGVELDKRVSFAGYAFKLMRYESGERDPKNPDRYIDKRAPLLLGSGVVLRTDRDRMDIPGAWRTFGRGIMILVGSVLVLAVGITLWFRRSDRQARQQIDNYRSRNPFADGTVEPTRTTET